MVDEMERTVEDADREPRTEGRIERALAITIDRKSRRKIEIAGVRDESSGVRGFRVRLPSR